MQWAAEKKAGFTTGAPWLPVADDVEAINVDAAKSDPNSLLALYRHLIELRRREPALAVGSFKAVPADGDLLVFRREAASAQAFLVALNFGTSAVKFSNGNVSGKVALSTCLDRDQQIVEGAIELRPQEGIIVELQSRAP
jgi:alpha-glucosidase